jgi:hypothetical protein
LGSFEVDENSHSGSSAAAAEVVDPIRLGLSSRRQDENFTIRTIGSADTILLGTDTDPCNGYRNLWAANQVDDLMMKSLVQCDIGRRVMDGENVGLSYAREVDKKRGYNVEGVRKAVKYFLRQGLHVVVVAKREATKRDDK